MEEKGNSLRYNLLFSKEEKAAAFDQIADQYYLGNFGRMSKTDFETLLFSIYIERCLEKKQPYGDYQLSRDLGITQSKVRSLKIRKELQYPYKEFDWKTAFVDAIPQARYDERKRMIKIPIGDVNVLIELRNYVESKGWYDEYQLNPKLFQCRTDTFLALCRNLQDENENCDFTLSRETRGKLKELQKKAAAENEKTALEKILSGSFEDGIQELLLNASKIMITETLKAIPFGGLAGKAVSGLIQAIEYSK